jgi:hypothetical protein
MRKSGPKSHSSNPRLREVDVSDEQLAPSSSTPRSRRWRTATAVGALAEARALWTYDSSLPAERTARRCR